MMIPTNASDTSALGSGVVAVGAALMTIDESVPVGSVEVMHGEATPSFIQLVTLNAIGDKSALLTPRLLNVSPSLPSSVREEIFLRVRGIDKDATWRETDIPGSQPFCQLNCESPGR